MIDKHAEIKAKLNELWVLINADDDADNAAKDDDVKKPWIGQLIEHRDNVNDLATLDKHTGYEADNNYPWRTLAVGYRHWKPLSDCNIIQFRDHKPGDNHEDRDEYYILDHDLTVSVVNELDWDTEFCYAPVGGWA